LESSNPNHTPLSATIAYQCNRCFESPSGYSGARMFSRKRTLTVFYDHLEKQQNEHKSDKPGHLQLQCLVSKTPLWQSTNSQSQSSPQKNRAVLVERSDRMNDASLLTRPTSPCRRASKCRPKRLKSRLNRPVQILGVGRFSWILVGVKFTYHECQEIYHVTFLDSQIIQLLISICDQNSISCHLSSEIFLDCFASLGFTSTRRFDIIKTFWCQLVSCLHFDGLFFDSKDNRLLRMSVSSKYPSTLRKIP
jgi:hypothetical protein